MHELKRIPIFNLNVVTCCIDEKNSDEKFLRYQIIYSGIVLDEIKDMLYFDLGVGKPIFDLDDCIIIQNDCNCKIVTGIYVRRGCDYNLRFDVATDIKDGIGYFYG